MQRPRRDPWRWVGGVLLLQYVLVLAVKIARGAEVEMLWLSNVSLLAAAIGLLFDVRLLTASALAAVLVPHGLWLVDLGGWFLTDRFPLSIASYMTKLGPVGRAATAHHLYLVPTLVAWAWRQRELPRLAPVLASVAFCALTAMSRVAMPRSRNVNFGYEFLPECEGALFEWINSLPAPTYLALLNLLFGALFFGPYLAWRRALGRKGAQRRRSTADAVPMPDLESVGSLVQQASFESGAAERASAELTATSIRRQGPALPQRPRRGPSPD